MTQPERRRALAHLPGSFGAQQCDADAVAFANATNGVEPANERLTLASEVRRGLRRPCALVDEFNGGAAKLLAEFFRF